MSKLDDLARLGQSIWLDFIHRDLLTSGRLDDLISQGLRGMTSNPSIFDQAISRGGAYDDDIKGLVASGKSVQQIYETLAFADIRSACDALRPVFDRSDRLDGYVSLEVNPTLAHDTQGTINQVRSYFHSVDRPNLMIKIPATREGIPAIQAMLGEGINVNVTLMFSIGQLDDVAEAFLSGLEHLKSQGGDLTRIASVASFFVSRVDSMIDPLLDQKGETELRGRLGVANARLAYRRFTQIYHTQRWTGLSGAGARVQRVLWGSTSTKDPSYPDTMYVDELIGPDTVNTVPPETLEAFLDHGTAARTVDRDVEGAQAAVDRLSDIGIDLDEVTDQLLIEGVDKFARAFDNLLQSLETKRAALQPS
jgi:transaldolase